MSTQRIPVLGRGFASLWSAVVAACKLDELEHGPDAVVVTFVDRDGFHNIRVRNYETGISAVRVPLDDILRPIGVECIEGEVADLDVSSQSVAVTTGRGKIALPND
jgi:NADH:ubiquinone reductase (H+-translocating)